MWKEFKEFAMKGNVLDLAIGIVIGGAFGKIVSSFVSDLLMPLLSLFMGKVDFKNMFIPLSAQSVTTLDEAKRLGIATINWGIFLNTIIDFLIIAFAIFFVIRQINKLRPAEPPADPVTKECPYCLTQIPLKAVKCSSCTADLKEPDAEK